MGEAAERLMSPEEYLAWEREQPVKHEFAGGVVVAMVGASLTHGTIVGNVTGELRAALRDKGCRVVPADLRVHIPATGSYRYPDVTVVCHPIHLHDEQNDTLLNPSVIVEVLSESTEGTERGAKFREYRSIPSMREYLLIDQNVALVEHYTRGENERWTFQDAGLDDTIKIVSCGVELQVREVYLNVFPLRQGPRLPRRHHETRLGAGRDLQSERQIGIAHV